MTGGLEACRTRCRRAVPYYLYRPTSAVTSAQVLVSVHGIARNAKDHAKAFTSLTEAGFLVVAPLFQAERYPDYQRLGRKGRGRRADKALFAVLGEVSERLGIDTERCYYYGHSGGGQFVHRLAFAYPSRIRRYVLSAPGWYTLPDWSLRYPKGVKRSADYRGPDFDLDAALRIPAKVIVGGGDRLREDSLRQTSFVDSHQGRDRVARAHAWVDAMRFAARIRGLATEFELSVIPEIGHDFAGLSRRGDLARRVLEWLCADDRSEPEPPANQPNPLIAA